ncbi:MAG TPA: hypothetical protein VHM24_08915 [Gemmatimonadaceae bacterium]|nr:hypothetical protein [Gemmatimonadaceae bacterium]
MRHSIIVAAAGNTLLTGGAYAFANDRGSEERSVPPVYTEAPETPAPANQSRSAGVLRYVTVPEGTAARYRIREQLVGLDLPNDAVGETKRVTGVITRHFLPLPKSGKATFRIMGDLTVCAKTKPTTWNVSAQFASGAVTGTANTSFTFREIEIEQPRVPVLLSVADTIRLELDFSMVAAPAK